MSLTATGHDKKTLLPLEHYSWWEQNFPHKQGINWLVAADALFRAQEKVGVFHPERLRGRGAWPEKDKDGKMGVLLHLGDRMVVPGSKNYAEPDTYVSPTRYIYERAARLDGPSDPMPVEESREVPDRTDPVRCVE